jgi:hypothetical protein
MATTGSAPTVHDYLAWRIAHDKSLPCLAKVYDLFPGKWPSIKTLARATQAVADKVPRVAAFDSTIATTNAADGWTSVYMALPLKAQAVRRPLSRVPPPTVERRDIPRDTTNDTKQRPERV